jgi:hypothetical protein
VTSARLIASASTVARSALAVAHSRSSMRPAQRTSISDVRSPASDGCPYISEIARLAWRTESRWLPDSRALRAAAPSARTASTRMVAGTLSTEPSSATSSAAVAAWCAMSSIAIGA